MTLDQLKFLAGAAEAVQSRNTAEMRIKGETLVALAELIEAAVTPAEDTDNGES